MHMCLSVCLSPVFLGNHGSLEGDVGLVIILPKTINGLAIYIVHNMYT